MVEMHIQNVGGCGFRKVEKCNGCTKTLSILLHGLYFFSNMMDPNCWLHYLVFERFDCFKCCKSLHLQIQISQYAIMSCWPPKSLPKVVSSYQVPYIKDFKILELSIYHNATCHVLFNLEHVFQDSIHPYITERKGTHFYLSSRSPIKKM
jgi:hypothetical protein